MVEIRTLAEFDADGFRQLVTGYVSNAKYAVSKTESDDHVAIVLELVGLKRPYVKRYDPPDEETLQRYREVLKYELSLGAYDRGQLVGVALAEPQSWNRSLWIWEFHVAEAQRGRGVGRQMMEELAERSRSACLRTMVCETQSTNVPAIRFYQRLGFRVEGIDLSYYTNEDWPYGEVAVFMKRRLE